MKSTNEHRSIVTQPNSCRLVVVPPIGARRKIVWLLKATLALACPTSFAVEPYWYMGASGGQTRAKIDQEKIIANLMGGGLVTTMFSEDNRDSGFKVFGGYQFSRYIALEAGYADLGRFGFSLNTLPLGSLSGTIRIRGANIDLVGTVPISERVSAFARVGAFYGRAKDEFLPSGLVMVTNLAPSASETNLKAGIGLQYEVSQAFSLRLEAERHRLNDAVGNRGDIDLYSLGLVYRFINPPPPRPMPEPVQAAYIPPPPPVAVLAAPPPTVVVTPPQPVVQPPRQTQFTFSADALFEFDRFQVGPTGASHLDAFAEKLRALSYDTVTVTGHADRIGSPTYNQALSLKRADAVKAYLVEKNGVEANRIRVEGRGETVPLTQPTDCVGAQATKQLIVCLQPDRRVVVDVSGLK